MPSVRMMGQSIGPVFGGLITQFFGFRAIFWFLTILGVLSLGNIILLLPETLRNIAGNGTVRLTGFQMSLIYSFTPQPDAMVEPNDVPKRKITVSSFVGPL
jgi:MFS family permease